MTRYELDQKLVFVVKKEIKNLERLHRAFFETYPLLGNKRVLIIDDEADFASFGFTKTKNEGIEIRRIAGKIDEFRQGVTSSSFLQVTATPYSLYLQPDDYSSHFHGTIFKPVKPAFTVLVPVHDHYIGGEYYFDESEKEDSIAYHLFREVPEHELQVLRKQDRRSFKIEECLNSRRVERLREAIVNFIVGGCIRRIQCRALKQNEKKFSFIIHTEQNKQCHEWQESIIREIKTRLAQESVAQTPVFKALIEASYENLIASVSLCTNVVPTYEEVLDEVKRALELDYVMITVVNSEKDVTELLDETGQLKLRTPLNIFIGGQMLDRGITVSNLIGFYYGRNPKSYQQDTVLQHSRMYGARPMEDLAVTRFYTTANIYNVMKRIHEFDSALRKAFENGSHDHGVIFIQKDAENRIIPCSPNKLLLSKTTTLKPSSRLLPTGFQLKSKTHLIRLVSAIEKIVKSYTTTLKDPFLMNVNDAIRIIEYIRDTLQPGHNWDVKAFVASLEYFSRETEHQKHKGHIWVLIRTDREASRFRAEGRPENSPDSYQEKEIARQIARDIPCLILLRQNGNVEKGWTGSPFWWPVLITPSATRTVIFTSEEATVVDDFATNL